MPTTPESYNVQDPNAHLRFRSMPTQVQYETIARSSGITDRNALGYAVRQAQIDPYYANTVMGSMMGQRAQSAQPSMQVDAQPQYSPSMVNNTVAAQPAPITPTQPQQPLQPDSASVGVSEATSISQNGGNVNPQQSMLSAEENTAIDAQIAAQQGTAPQTVNSTQQMQHAGRNRGAGNADENNDAFWDWLGLTSSAVGVGAAAERYRRNRNANNRQLEAARTNDVNPVDDFDGMRMAPDVTDTEAQINRALANQDTLARVIENDAPVLRGDVVNSDAVQRPPVGSDPWSPDPFENTDLRPGVENLREVNGQFFTDDPRTGGVVPIGEESAGYWVFDRDTGRVFDVRNMKRVSDPQVEFQLARMFMTGNLSMIDQMAGGATTIPDKLPRFPHNKPNVNTPRPRNPGNAFRLPF